MYVCFFLCVGEGAGRGGGGGERKTLQVTFAADGFNASFVQLLL